MWSSFARRETRTRAPARAQTPRVARRRTRRGDWRPRWKSRQTRGGAGATGAYCCESRREISAEGSAPEPRPECGKADTRQGCTRARTRRSHVPGDPRPSARGAGGKSAFDQEGSNLQGAGSLTQGLAWPGDAPPIANSPRCRRSSRDGSAGTRGTRRDGFHARARGWDCTLAGRASTARQAVRGLGKSGVVASSTQTETRPLRIISFTAMLARPSEQA